MTALTFTVTQACPSGKVGHEGQADAARHARHAQGGVKPYPCDLCGKWHVGRRRDDSRDQRRRFRK